MTESQSGSVYRHKDCDDCHHLGDDGRLCGKWGCSPEEVSLKYRWCWTKPPESMSKQPIENTRRDSNPLLHLAEVYFEGSQEAASDMKHRLLASLNKKQKREQSCQESVASIKEPWVCSVKTTTLLPNDASPHLSKGSRLHKAHYSTLE